MSSRRNGSVSRAAEAASKNRLHMDRNPQHPRITDPSNPAGRRKEIDNVMKRARQASPGSWDRQLLEAEQKDPNRWRHTGYKKMYLDRSRSRSGSPVARGARSPGGRRSRSPVAGRRSPRRSPPRRSPLARSPGRRAGRPRSPVPKRRAATPPRRAASPPRRAASPPRRAVSPPRRAASPPRRAASPPRRAASPPRRAAPRPAVRPVARPGARPQRPPSPPDPRKSSSGSSSGSCSDESCSVCSGKNGRAAAPAPAAAAAAPARKRAAPPAPGARPQPPPGVVPTRELMMARETSKRSREEKVLEWQRSQLAVNRPPPGTLPIPPSRIKREGVRRPERPERTERRDRPVSPAAIHHALNDSDSSTHSEEQPQRLTLSERFGKMAQWSLDRSQRLENMRITRRAGAGASLQVARIQDDADRDPGEIEEAPVGSYPEELLSAAPGGMPSWDDVTVRYDYYKERGYLRGLTLGDYVKWEEWWYKYQEWLKRERAYERWAEGEGTVRRERRRRGGRHRRS